MARFFNTAGPNRPERHYTVPALARLPDLPRLIEQESWFVVHAPRQSGKTTAMRALAVELTASGSYAALWASCEMGEPFGDEPAAAERTIIDEIVHNARIDLPAPLRPPAPSARAAKGAALAGFLRVWSERCPLPVVLLLDEIDALRDRALISVLRQLRSIYPQRPRAAPPSVALIGLRDVREYKVAGGGSGRLGTASPFNVKSKALTVGIFSLQEVATLYAQHTAETGQAFHIDAVELAHALTGGQPWLVNALAAEVIAEMAVSGEILPSHIQQAKERLILARSTHLDSLADKLNDPRVRGVIASILAGVAIAPSHPTRDIDLCVDLGLVRRSRGGLEIANPIYREVLPRELTVATDNALVVTPRRWSLADGRLDLDGILQAFVAFWRKDGEWMAKGQSWPEAAHQIVLMAFLQRLVNGGGTIEREYGLGTGRLDPLIRWHVRVDAYGAALEEDQHALEVKVWRDGQADPLAQGLEQLEASLARLGFGRGVLIVFDARAAAPLWAERGSFAAAETASGRAVVLLRAQRRAQRQPSVPVAVALWQQSRLVDGSGSD